MKVWKRADRSGVWGLGLRLQTWGLGSGDRDRPSPITHYLTPSP